MELAETKDAALSKVGKYAESLTYFDTAIALNPDHENAWYNKGLSLNKLGKYELAIESFDEAIRINPVNADAWYSKANAYNKLKQYDDAVSAYEKVIEFNPENANAWNNKGNALYNKYISGSDDISLLVKANEAYKKALWEDPYNSNAAKFASITRKLIADKK